ncbi:hypothetical protein F5B22DRAFT_659561 [Xylaria bambusicola]|uniref:uncharacterized protein n=1 Tax=Xylaria bambusicola TaxID=326684 RepID=UPI0020078C6D|nr:uncharacterized protein F5B22DRAFT_659561 [Xylaria bambusicola]KAI0523809.1 hypothetical protein F5B22DRAFT_659561 [Xylaria bambusicola]
MDFTRSASTWRSPSRGRSRNNSTHRGHSDHPRASALTQLLSRSHPSHTYGTSWRGGVIDDEEALLAHSISSHELGDDEHRRSQADERRLSQILNSDPVRSMRLIGNSNPRYKWERYWKSEEQLKTFSKPVRQYYERINYLVQQYLYIDRLLDSSLPHDLLNEYNDLPHNSSKGVVEVPETITEETGSSTKKVKRTPKDIYRPSEVTPLFNHEEEDEEDETPKPEVPEPEDDDDIDSSDPIVTLAIYVNFAANFLLLAGKIVVMISVSSMSVLASLVDAILDFLSTVIVWITTALISRQDQYKYPVGRRRLEPLGVLVFSVIMITSFVQVALQSIQRLASGDHKIIELGIPEISIMVGTVVIKGLCWIWCRLVKNSSVQALAADAMTDVIFNTGSIIFPIAGFYLGIWWLDALGGLLLSLVVIKNWSQTSLQHIKNLSGFSATADQRNILLYLTMRFAKTIRQIQGIQAYHSGDKLIAEVDIILDASTTLRDSHDLSESLSYVLESVPIVDRAFVHADYSSYNFLPTHMEQQSG